MQNVLSEFSSFRSLDLSNFKMHFAFVWNNLIVVNALPFQMFHFVASMLLFCRVLCVSLLWQAADMNQKWILAKTRDGIHAERKRWQNTNGKCGTVARTMKSHYPRYWVRLWHLLTGSPIESHSLCVCVCLCEFECLCLTVSLHLLTLLLLFRSLCLSLSALFVFAHEMLSKSN